MCQNLDRNVVFRLNSLATMSVQVREIRGQPTNLCVYVSRTSKQASQNDTWYYSNFVLSFTFDQSKLTV